MGAVTCRRISEMSMTLMLEPAFFAPALRFRTQKGQAVAMTSAPTASASWILSMAMLTAKSLNADLYPPPAPQHLEFSLFLSISTNSIPLIFLRMLRGSS